MQNAKTRRMVLCAIFVALIVVFTLVPYTGYINYGLFIEITTLHIVVILGAVALGWKYGALLGGVWGVTCLLRAFTNPLWAPFLNPLISVLPRIIVGVVAGALYSWLSRRMAGRRATPLHSVVAGLLSGGLIFGALTLSVDAQGQALVGWPIGGKIALAAGLAVAITALFLWLGRRYKSPRAYAAAIAALGGSLTNTVLVLGALTLFGYLFQGTQVFFNLFKGVFSTIIGINGGIELLAAVLITPVVAMAVLGHGKQGE